MAGTVLLVAALASGVVERIPISFPMIFLGLGFLLGERGLGLLHVDTHNEEETAPVRRDSYARWVLRRLRSRAGSPHGALLTRSNRRQ